MSAPISYGNISQTIAERSAENDLALIRVTPISNFIDCDARIKQPISAGLRGHSQELSLETVCDLSQSCRHFQYLSRDDNLCKMLLKSRALYCTETADALQDGRYARAFRRLVKRRRAVAQASPFAVAIVGVADSYALHNGKLLYIVGERPSRKLRILDLQHSTNQEIVADIQALVTRAVPESEGCRKYVFRILHHAAGITSCLYSFARPTTQNWLLVFDAQKHKLIDSIPLDSTIRLFVRNNSEYLIFGTHSNFDINGIRKWVLRHYDLRTRHLEREIMHLPNLVGYEIGSAVCFEIFDQYLYGCSNQTSFDLEEIDWTSYYYCFRIPLHDFNKEKKQVVDNRYAFRRQHAEGPIDDRWTFLNLEIDEETGMVKIVECRREWLNGGSDNMRTYYTKDAHFRSQDSESDGDGPSGRSSNENDPLPNDQLARLLTSCDRPNYVNAPRRLLHEYHPGDHGPAMFTRSQAFWSYYSPPSNTFIDLVNDPLPSASNIQRLRLRTGHRPCHTSATQHGPHGHQLGQQEINNTGQYNTISYWPPGQALVNSGTRGDTLEKLDQVMNPAGLCGSVTATGNDRSVVYSTSTGEAGATKVLVLLSFDPAVRLSGMFRAGCLHAEVETEVYNEEDIKDNAVGAKALYNASQWPCCSGPDAHKSQEAHCSETSPPSVVSWSVEQNLPLGAVHSPDKGSSWASIDDAMHHKFSAKYDFSFYKGQCQ